MRGALLALLGLPALACYTGLPPDRAGGSCLVDDDCASGACMDGVCLPPDGPGTGLPNSSSGGSTGDPGTTSESSGNTSESSSGGNTTTTTSGGNSSSGGGTTSTGGSAGGSTGGVDPTSAGGTSGGGTTGAGDTTGGGSTTGEPTECDPNDPNVEVDPAPGDKPGDPCCTTRDSCTGKDVNGANPQVADVGDQMECIGGVWTVDETECTENCELKGNSYLGCFWDSYYGLHTPLCGCQ